MIIKNLKRVSRNLPCIYQFRQQSTHYWRWLRRGLWTESTGSRSHAPPTHARWNLPLRGRSCPEDHATSAHSSLHRLTLGWLSISSRNTKHEATSFWKVCRGHRSSNTTKSVISKVSFYRHWCFENSLSHVPSQLHLPHNVIPK